MIKSLAILVLGLLLGVALAQGNAAPAEAPHFKAIRLVMEQRAAELNSVDPKNDWWHDTKRRTWTTRRPFEPGVFDTTNSIQVTYSVEDEVLANWNVNTRTGQVAGPGQEFHME